MTPNKNYHTSQPDYDSAIDRTVPDFPVAEVLDEDRYFQTHEAPSYLGEIEAQIEAFVDFHREKTHKKIVLVTSGGTTVPLENNTVRFIDNFSAGTRGATSSEYFLESSYAVIFLHREFSLLPYSRHYSHTTNCFLDYIVEKDNKVEINPEFADSMLVVLRKYAAAQKANTLLLVPFTTVNQYLYTLRSASQLLQRAHSNALFYLAAAVSDFFLPSSRMPKHKIQAQPSGKLAVDLEQVPKFLRRLVDSWAPLAMIVSFKLETDSNLLIQKSVQALHRYHHQLVIGNLLQTRKNEVVLVTPRETQAWIRLTEEQKKQGVEIESVIIPAVIDAHRAWVDQTRKSNQ
ncbi:DFP-domain-containing protein [Metschnikowia bicuspidata]|uniref:DFP-domain-containing protein n=1 Tax=Metschnikowia bicuspidata TaxID=27322 RepID=A0A4P9ZEQ5_9ASCO|nr:DFP-domain-containing protein [Metschnikowia bicuspidata]